MLCAFTMTKPLTLCCGPALAFWLLLGTLSLIVFVLSPVDAFQPSNFPFLPTQQPPLSSGSGASATTTTYTNFINRAESSSKIWTLQAASKSSEHSDDTPEQMERVWRSVKKPLLRIGARGATAKHGNSLRQLLDDHTAVKVKINTAPYGGDLETAFDTLKQLAVASGAAPDLELLQCRAGEQIILVGLPGTRKRIEAGDYPPPPPPPPVVTEEDGIESRNS